MTAKVFPWGKVGTARGADNPAVPVVPNAKVRMEAQHPIPLLSLQQLLGKFLPLPLPMYTQ
jgi:hypothetical protein